MTKVQETLTSKSIDHSQIYIVEASAGSGKTYALAKRYIQLLLAHAQKEEAFFKNILAITFTNKAALEMKERISESLKKIALDKCSKAEEEILDSLSGDRQAAQRKAYLLMDEIIRNYNFFQVQTIDSFINSVICGCAFILGLSSNFRIREDSGDYLAFSLDSLIDRALKDKLVLRIFKNFLKQYIYIENKTGWLVRRDILAVIVSMFGEFNVHQGEFLKLNIPDTEIMLKKKGILKLLKDLSLGLPPGTNKNFSDKLSGFLAENKESFDIDELSDYFAREDFPINKGFELSLNTQKLWKDLRKGIKQLCELEMNSLFNCYIDIFNEALGEFRSLSRSQDALFLEELNKEAQELFGKNQITVPELYYRLSLRLKHFLIDEFQDTSILQWINLSPMVEEAISTGGTLFYVGDKKQAIFRFRGGEVSLFDSVRDRFKDYKAAVSTLRINYRSQKEIVEFNNQIFSEENLTRFMQEFQSAKKNNSLFGSADIQEITRVFGDAQQSYKEENKDGFVKVEFIDSEDSDNQGALIKSRLIKLVDELRGRFGYQNIAILVRKNEDVALLTEWLLEYDIPVESEKTLNIRENPLIKEFISLLKFLNSPIDNLSFASFILGEIFIAASGIKRDDIEGFLFEINLASKKRNTGYYYKEFRNRFPRAWTGLLEELFRRVGFVPLYELVLGACERLKVFKNFPETHGFFMRLFELIKEKEEEHSTISAFLDYFDRAPQEHLYVNVTKSDAVKILTIHKAKGLGFGAVIMPFLEIDVKVGGARNNRAQNYLVQADNSSGENKIRLLRLKSQYAKFCDQAKKIYAEEYKEAFLDELNNIYVALTRAECEMHIFIPKKSANANNPVRLLIQQESERGKKIKYLEKKKKGQVLQEIAPASYKEWHEALKDEFKKEYEIINLEKMLKGEIIHCVLSCIGNAKAKKVDALVEKAIETAAFKFPQVKDFTDYEEIAKNLLKKEALKKFFYLDTEVFLEKEIVDSRGNIRRLDRLVVGAVEAWILDYKSVKAESAADQQQVKEYIGIVKQIYPKKQIKGYLLYLDDLSLEEVNG